MLKNNRMWGEKVNLQLRFDFFNVLNHVNLVGEDGNLVSTTFGKVISTGDPRVRPAFVLTGPCTLGRGVRHTRFQ